MIATQTVFRPELFMRVFSLALAAGLAAVCLSTSLQGQQPAAPLDARSMQLLTQARALQAAGNLDGATDALETAIAVDPRNRGAFVVLAEIAEARGLPGKSIRLYREALTLQPNDTAALRGQGEALVAKGAVARAKDNLGKIEALCKGRCPDAVRLSAAIAKGPPVTTAQAEPAVKQATP